MSLFSKGLADIMNDTSSDREAAKELAELILKPEDGYKYIVRILDEIPDLVSFWEHNYIPTFYVKKDGEKSPGFASFFCTQKPDCPLCNTTIVDQKTKELVQLKARNVLAIPMFIKEKKSNRKGKDSVEKIEENKILILSQGKNKQNWRQLFDSYEERGTLKDRYYVVSRTGTGKDTVWSIQPLDKSEFEYEADPIDTENVIKNCGRWKDYKSSKLLINTGNNTPKASSNNDDEDVYVQETDKYDEILDQI